MSPPIYRLTPLVAALQVFSAAAAAETLSYFASPEAAEATLSFNTNCAVNDINLNRSARTLTCPGGAVPPAPECTSFAGVSLTSAPNATPARVVDARRGDTLLFTGTCTKGQGSTSNVPLSYQLLPSDGEAPIATSQTDAQFAVKVPSDAAIGSLVSYRLRAEQAGAVSASITAAYKVVDAPIAAPGNCSVSPSSTSWTSGGTSPQFTVGCTGLGTNPAYRWLVGTTVQSSQSATLAAGALNGLAAGSYSITARVCNDPSQADTGGSSCATAGATAVVNALNVTPTPSNCAITYTPESPVASGAAISFGLTGCVNTGGSGYTTSYQWSRNGAVFGSLSSASTSITNSGTSAATHTINVSVCNTPVGGGTAVCQSPAPSTSVTVSPGTPSNAPSCTNISGIRTTHYLEHDLATEALNRDINDPLQMLGQDAYVVAFKTPNYIGSQAAGILAGPTVQSGESKMVVLATTPCAEYNGAGVISYQIGNTITLYYYLGSGGTPLLSPDTTYYLTITNRNYSGGFQFTCAANTACPTKLTINRP